MHDGCTLEKHAQEVSNHNDVFKNFHACSTQHQWKCVMELMRNDWTDEVHLTPSTLTNKAMYLQCEPTGQAEL